MKHRKEIRRQREKEEKGTIRKENICRKNDRKIIEINI